MKTSETLTNDDLAVDLSEAVLLIENNNTVFTVPAMFAMKYSSYIESGVDSETLLNEKMDQEYKDTWDRVLATTGVELMGEQHSLYQDNDGDLWAVPIKFID